MNTVSANFLHKDRSIARYRNTPFSSPAMDLYNKHVKCAYPQAEKHPIFVLKHKHIVRGSNPHCGITAKTPEARILLLRLSAVSACDADGDGDPLAKCPRRGGRAAASQHGANFLFQAQFFKAVWTGVEDMLQFAAALWCQFIGGVEKLKH